MMPSWPQLLILIAVIVLLFGTKKLRTLGSDLGAAVKGFKKAMNDDDEKKESDKNDANFSSTKESSGVENNNDKKE